MVVIFLGADPASITRNGVHGAAYLAQAADMAVALAKGEKPARKPIALSSDNADTEVTRAMAPQTLRPRHFLRRHLLLRGTTHSRRGGDRGVLERPDGGQLAVGGQPPEEENTIVDMGADEFCQGHPHPMIDPSQRDARIREEVDDPTTAVVLFDVVLGYGSPKTRPRACRRRRSGQSQGESGRPARRVHRLRLRNRSRPTESGQDRGRPQICRRARGLVQCRGCHLVGQPISERQGVQS